MAATYRLNDALNLRIIGAEETMRDSPSCRGQNPIQ